MPILERSSVDIIDKAIVAWKALEAVMDAMGVQASAQHTPLLVAQERLLSIIRKESK